jgi:MoaA/NifB/PqqE/SkfB family radical SAM enzyme
MDRGNSKYQLFVNKYRSLTWIVSHLKYYISLNSHVLAKGIPARELLLLKFPLILPDAPKPPTLSIDITDACNLQCQYCNNPLFPHPRNMMSDEVIEQLLKQIECAHINRIRIGGGEPTLHPGFANILKEISSRTKFLSIITNGQWEDPHYAKDILESGVDLIEISVDAGGAEIYEMSRINASYDKLLKNLAYLYATRNEMKSSSQIKIRLMLRPSTLHLEKEYSQFLLDYCDCILPQMVIKHPDSQYDEDVFIHLPKDGNDDRICTLPFKDLQVRPDGSVPLCSAIGCSLDKDKQVYLGNISDFSILELWNSDKMVHLRQMHRSRKGATLITCRDCQFS